MVFPINAVVLRRKDSGVLAEKTGFLGFLKDGQRKSGMEFQVGEEPKLSYGKCSFKT